MRFLFFAVILAISSTVKADVAQVRALLRVGDYQQARQQVELAFLENPSNQDISKLRLQVYSEIHDDALVSTAWKEHLKVFSSAQDDTDLLEDVAWGILRGGAASPAMVVQYYALVGSRISNDIRGVELLKKGMLSSNSAVRTAAVQLSHGMRDTLLQEEVLRRLDFDNSFSVRMEALKAVGTMHINDGRNRLQNLLETDSVTVEERALALQSLVNLLENIERPEIAKFVESTRAGLRALACRAVSYFDRKEETDLIEGLLSDHNATVRYEALVTLGHLRAVSYDLVRPMLNDPDPIVAMTAGWALALYDSRQGKEALLPWLEHANPVMRRRVAALAASAGNYAVNVLETAFDDSSDLFVRANAAIGLIGQRVRTLEAAQFLNMFLGEQRSLLMWQNEWPLRILSPSEVPHVAHIPHYPETVDQIARLEILNMMSVVGLPDIQNSFRSFIQAYTWEVSGAALATALSEGNEESAAVVEGLLDDPDSETRIRAAMVLALWRHNPRSREVLEAAYKQSDRKRKERILEGLGSIGSKESLPFLAQQLHNPYPAIRMIAAAAVIQCLNH